VTGIQTYIATEVERALLEPQVDSRDAEGGLYAGARAIANTMENLYGWQATSAEHMDRTFWQNSYDVCRRQDGWRWTSSSSSEPARAAGHDGSHVGSGTGRDRTSSRRAEGRAGSQIRADGGEDWRDLLRKYLRDLEVASVQFAEQAALVPGLGTEKLAAFGSNMAKATGWKAAAFAHAPAACAPAFKKGLSRPRFSPATWKTPQLAARPRRRCRT